MQYQQILYVDGYVNPWVQTLTKTLMGSLFIALCAQISIPLPFTPVPLTCQTLSILFLGATLGSKQAMGCTILYLLEIFGGMPVLAGGLANSYAFAGPRAGYLFAMPILAYIAGMTSIRKASLYNFVLLFSGSLLLLALGSCLLANFVGWNHAFPMGFFPFIPGDALKALFVTFYITRKRNTRND